MRVRVVVADLSEARFYDTSGLNAPLQLVGTFTDPKARLHERDLVSDRPGRVFDHAAPARGRRGSVAHHGTNGDRSARRHETETFARHVTRALHVALRENQIDRIVLVAAPAFLGMLREIAPPAVKAAVVAEVRKDLVHQSERVLQDHLPPKAFAGLTTG